MIWKWKTSKKNTRHSHELVFLPLFDFTLLLLFGGSRLLFAVLLCFSFRDFVLSRRPILQPLAFRSHSIACVGGQTGGTPYPSKHGKSR